MFITGLCSRQELCRRPAEVKLGFQDFVCSRLGRNGQLLIKTDGTFDLGSAKPTIPTAFLLSEAPRISSLALTLCLKKQVPKLQTFLMTKYARPKKVETCASETVFFGFNVERALFLKDGGPPKP